MPPTDANLRRLHLIDRLIHLPAEHLDALEYFLASLPTRQNAPPIPAPAVQQPDWPHAPTHRISEAGTYIVTACTLDKAHIFKGAERLDYLMRELRSDLQKGGWILEAWAVFSNHYHFVAHSQPGATLLNLLLGELHRRTSLHVNELDCVARRQTWYQFWDTRLTFESSYLARLRYVHYNPVKHGLVCVATQYPWCSAGWFERTATPAQVKMLAGVKTDRVHVEDDFDPV